MSDDIERRLAPPPEPFTSYELAWAYAVKNVPRKEDCNHPAHMVDISPHVLFKVNALHVRCRQCGRAWRITGSGVREIP